jgi:hypothetical protein
MNTIIIYLILITILFSVFIYVLYNHSIKFKAQSIKDIESDSADIIESENTIDAELDTIAPIDYDIIIPLHDDKIKHEHEHEHEQTFTGEITGDTMSQPTLEMFYDSVDTIFPSAVSKGDTSIDGRNCHWKMYKKPNYYGCGPWGKFHYGEPYTMKIRCEGDNNCSDDLCNCLKS